jgi:hypothetical protein
LLADGDESDVCGLPDAEDDGVAAGGELPTGLLDRGLSEFGAVEGKQDGSGNRRPWMCRPAISVCAFGRD